MRIRAKTGADQAACVELLRLVHTHDGYPRYLPEDVARFVTPPYERAAWVAESGGQILGHVALHDAAVDPTLDVATRATGLPAEDLAVVARLFVDPIGRRAGAGGALLRHATSEAHREVRRAVLSVEQSLIASVALYEAEGWTRAGSLGAQVGPGATLDLWVYIGPDS